MKQFTIISSPICEPLLRVALDKTSFVQLKEAAGEEFETIKGVLEICQDFTTLNSTIKKKYEEIQRIIEFDEGPVKISLDELKDFIENPEKTVREFVADSETVKVKLQDAIKQNRILSFERQNILCEKKQINGSSQGNKIRCLGVGNVNPELVSGLTNQLDRIPGLRYETHMEPEKTCIIVYGLDRMKNITETLFDAFEVKDIVDSLEKDAILFAYDYKQHVLLMEEFNWELVQLQLLVEKETNILDLRRQINILYELIEIKKKINFSEFIRKIRFLRSILEILSDENAPVLRTKLLSIIQGWIEKQNEDLLCEIVDNIRDSTKDMIYIAFTEPSCEEKAIPTPLTKVKPALFQPATALTTLRGWPSAHEINPSIINIVIFCVQFGLMFGDVGQGSLLILLGFMFNKRAKGIAAKIGAIMVPMGIASIFFGFMYGEVFLMEGIIEPILYSPIHNIGKFMRLIVGVATIEILIGLVISAVNHIKKHETLEALGEHGLGAVLFVIGTYYSCIAYIQGVEISSLFSYWSFNLMLVGLLLSAAIPLISSIHRKSLSIEVVGEIVGALMMTLVESLSGFFSFLRIAAFAFAHGALGLASHALSTTMSPILGVLITNGIAMTFEFISCTIQSLRLLYHEFLGKFYLGDGIRFKPFNLEVKPPLFFIVDNEELVTKVEIEAPKPRIKP